MYNTRDMLRYITLFQFTDQGIRNVKESPKRIEAGIKAAEKVGAKVLAAYYTTGAYDIVIITEVPSEEVQTAFVLAECTRGNVRSTTMRAFSVDEFSGIVQKIP